MNNRARDGRNSSDKMSTDDRQDTRPLVRVIRHSDIISCPSLIMLPDHYNDDGSCKCRKAGKCAVCQQPTVQPDPAKIARHEDGTELCVWTGADRG